MNLAQRVKAVLFTPRQAWTAIAAEPTDVFDLYARYVAILAIIPAAAGFVGSSLIGFSGPGFTIRVPLVNGLANMLVGYALSLVIIYVLAQITDALSPAFGGERNFLAALKLIAYGSTAGMVGGVFSVLPALSLLSLLASLYSIVLMYLGLPALMKCPRDKALIFTAVLLVCSLIGSAVLSIVAAVLR